MNCMKSAVWSHLAFHIYSKGFCLTRIDQEGKDGSEGWTNRLTDGSMKGWMEGNGI